MALNTFAGWLLLFPGIVGLGGTIRISQNNMPLLGRRKFYIARSDCTHKYVATMYRRPGSSKTDTCDMPNKNWIPRDVFRCTSLSMCISFPSEKRTNENMIYCIQRTFRQRRFLHATTQRPTHSHMKSTRHTTSTWKNKWNSVFPKNRGRERQREKHGKLVHQN